MARKFLTPIDLTGLELQNFKVQNLGVNPTPYGAGHSYYNTLAKELRIYDGTSWLPVGGSIEYGIYADIPAAGNNGRVYATTDTRTLYLDYGSAWIQIGPSGTSSYVNSVNGTANQIAVDQTTGDVTVSLPSYIDIPNGEIHTRKTEYWRDGDQYGIIAANPSSSGEFAVVAINQLALEANNGDIHIEPSTTLTIFNNNLTINGDGGIITTDVNSLHLTAYDGTVTTDTSEFHTPKVELWKDGDTSGSRLGVIVAHPSDGSLSIAASNQLVLESHSGTINIDPSNDYTWFGGNTYIKGSSGILGTDGGPLTLQADNGIITTLSQEIHTRKTEYWYGGDAAGYQRGSIAALSSGEFTVVATTGDLGLESNSGDVVIAANGNVKIDGNDGITFRDSGQTEYLNIYRSSTGAARLVAVDDLSLRATNDIILYPGNDVGGHTGKAYIHWGDDAANAHPEREIATIGTSQTFSNKTLNSATLGNNLNAGGYTITNLATPTNPDDAATKGYVDATAQGLFVLGSVRMASSTNLNITGNNSGAIGGVVPANGDRVLVKSQTTLTENGIYVYSSASQTLILSTNVVDADLKEGSYVLVEEGTYAAQGWIVTTFAAGASTWTQFSAAGEYTAGYGIDITGGAISVKLDSDSLSESGDGLKLNIFANGGLDNDGGVYVKTANGVKVDTSGNVTIDTTIVARKYSETITYTGTPTMPFTIMHYLGTKNVQVTVYEVATGEDVFVDVARTTTNAITVDFAVLPASGAYTVVVIG